MGRRGPKTKPQKLRAREGNPGNKPATSQPAAADPPDPPDWLEEQGQRLFKRLAPELAKMGCLAAVDAEPLARYCQELLIYRDALAQYNTRGMFEYTPNGMMVQSPAVSILHNADKILRSYEALFGLSPSARSSMHIDDGDQVIDELADLRLTG